MRSLPISFVLTLVITAVLSSGSYAQTSNSVLQREFIRSSSPLPGGQQVTSSYLPGTNQPAQIRVELANSNPNVQAYTPIQTYPPQSRGVVQTNYQVPYVAQRPVDPYAQPVVIQQQYPTVSAYQVPANQVPTLGIGPLNRTAYNNGCSTCGTRQTTYLPGNNIQTGAAVVAPPMTFGSQPTTFGVQPSIGNGPYRPIITLRNLPPGTYIGQGIIGQPKAYVDGQPVRNFVRYIFP
jgi:hypothetical protein